jgi:hypothetical protein
MCPMLLPSSGTAVRHLRGMVEKGEKEDNGLNQLRPSLPQNRIFEKEKGEGGRRKGGKERERERGRIDKERSFFSSGAKLRFLLN